VAGQLVIANCLIVRLFDHANVRAIVDFPAVMAGLPLATVLDAAAPDGQCRCIAAGGLVAATGCQVKVIRYPLPF
jgi:hypothetical protein